MAWPQRFTRCDQAHHRCTLHTTYASFNPSTALSRNRAVAGTRQNHNRRAQVDRHRAGQTVHARCGDPRHPERGSPRRQGMDRRALQEPAIRASTTIIAGVPGVAGAVEDDGDVLLRHMVSTVKKSTTASIVRACVRKNSRHVDSPRLPAGPSPAPRSTLRTVVADTLDSEPLQLADDLKSRDRQRSVPIWRMRRSTR